LWQLANSEKIMAPKKPLYGIFTDIPRHYDLINTVFTWGMDKGWRRKTARECLAQKPLKFLDLCCGTGDLAITVGRMASYPLEVKGLDYSHPMLDIAARKAARLDGAKIDFRRGEASQIPFPEEYFDGIGISFAFRNLTYKNPLAEKHLAEILRVLKPGGRCVIAESSQPGSKFIRSCYHFYMQQYTYRVGALISGNKPAYRYLADSTCRYYTPAELKDLLIGSGFSQVSYRPLLFGAGGIYTATK
jgi:demethylmenaquinone methyltransferase / 2-methoxy-6-polyprenyl-1,4-benzoquinol methylase